MPLLNWIGKTCVTDHHRAIGFRLLRCDSRISCGDAASGNLIVQGDNLDALKALLPYYAGQVECAFIDPPYNTGNEGWIYNDSVNSPEMRHWLGRVVGGENEDLTRHDKWLCMMYPRLTLMRELLREDGSLWVIVDDNEAHYARVILEEIFGAQNFVAQIAWQKVYSPRMDARGFSKDHDVIIVFQKSGRFRPRPVPFEQNRAQFSLWDEAAQRYYRRRSWRKEGSGSRRADRPNLYYPIPAPDGADVLPIKPDGSDGRWRGDINHYSDLERAGQIEWANTASGWQIYVKQYYDETASQPPSTVWLHDETGSNHEAIEELKRIFGASPFPTPKPVRLLRRVLQVACSRDGLVLDAFAGSGTTGHAVLAQNASDGGQRRFILAEMDAGIAQDITAERIRRVIEGYDYRDQRGGAHHEPGIGGGFRYCTLGETLFDQAGAIREHVTYEELARHVYFVETGAPLPAEGILDAPLLGIHNGTAVYLVTSGVLTYRRLSELPAHHGPATIYAPGCNINEQRLAEIGTTFKQIPYEIRVG